MDGFFGAQYGSGDHKYQPGHIITGVPVPSEIIIHIRPWPNIIDLGGLQGGPRDVDTLGRIMGEPGGGHQEEWYHGPQFRANRGTTQGWLALPTLFNVAVDSVV